MSATPQSQSQSCPTDCPNRQKGKYFVDKGFSYLSAGIITGILVLIASFYERQKESPPPFVVLPCVGGALIALFVPTEKTAEAVGVLLSMRIFSGATENEEHPK